jgi:hypothetical protein
VSEQQDYYEPWVPAVGQRVRVRLSGECRTPPHPESAAARVGNVGHAPWTDGITGVVMSDDNPYMGEGHRFLVAWDESYWYAQQWCTSAAYAAVELVPLDDEERRS